MGYMTPFMILNDAVDLLKDKKNAVKFGNDLRSAACNTNENERTISIGPHYNPVTALRTKHMNDKRVLFCGENMFIDISDWRELERYAKSDELESFEKIVDFSIDSLKIIKEEIQRYKKKK